MWNISRSERTSSRSGHTKNLKCQIRQNENITEYFFLSSWASSGGDQSNVANLRVSYDSRIYHWPWSIRCAVSVGDHLCKPLAGWSFLSHMMTLNLNWSSIYPSFSFQTCQTSQIYFCQLLSLPSAQQSLSTTRPHDDREDDLLKQKSIISLLLWDE